MAVKVSTTSSVWLDSSDLWLFCIEKDTFSIKLRDCPSVSINTKVVHASPVNKPLIRRRILLVDDGLHDMLNGHLAPTLLIVKSACDFKFGKDDVNQMFSVGDESWAVLVWSFHIVPGAKYMGRPDHANAIDLPGMPVVNIENSRCSCVPNLSGQTLVNNTPTQMCHSSSDSSDQEADVSADDHDNTIFSNIFAIKGSTYNELFQTNLKKVQAALRIKDSFSICLMPERDNPKDKNAHLVVAQINSSNFPLGYIGVKKIPKVTSAIRNNEITDIRVKSVNSYYVKNLNARKLKGVITIAKMNKWLPDCETNFYNSEL